MPATDCSCALGLLRTQDGSHRRRHTYSVVVNLDAFLRAELRELGSRLHNPVQIRGGFGVFAILDRLRQAGLNVEIDLTDDARW